MDREMLEAGEIRDYVEMFLTNKIRSYSNDIRDGYFSTDHNIWANFELVIFAVFETTEDRVDRYTDTLDNLRKFVRSCSKDFTSYTFIDFAVWLDNNAENLTHYILYGKEF